MWRMLRRPSPAMVVALIALFVALGGTATAVTVAVVPLAERANVADNALRLRGKTWHAVKGLITLKTRTVAVEAAEDHGYEDVSCDPGQHVIAGGYHYGPNDDAIEEWGSYPKDEDTWSVYLWQEEYGYQTEHATLYAVCMR
jgi:hypothetical protein